MPEQPTQTGSVPRPALALRLGPTDSVAVLTTDVASGAQVRVDREMIRAIQDIARGHKIALRPIAAGDPVLKYGQIIGFATATVSTGEHVHLHNMEFRTFVRAHVPGAGAKTTELVAESDRISFDGIVRADGRVATRNYLGILTTVNCSATVAKLVGRHFSRPGVLDEFPGVDGIVTLTHTGGCGMDGHGEGLEVLRRTLMGYARHPNFAGVLLIGLGCEDNQVEALIEAWPQPASTPLRVLTIQEEGGTTATVDKGIANLIEMLPEAAAATRRPVPVSELVLGLQCGGSDSFSGITANPALGVAADLIVAQGGTAVLGETPEIYGAEHLLTHRAVSPEVADKLLERIAWWESYTAANRGSMDNNPAPGNKAGGLTTILEKSLGAVAKGGSTDLAGVYDYAEPITGRGLVFMDTPGYDPVSVTGMVAGGANVVCFTTGRGSAFGCKPVPSLKLSTNTPLFLRMGDDMDLNCGTIVDGEVSVEEMGLRIFHALIATASGSKTKSEMLGFGDEEFAPWQMGAVM
ncbi:MAG: altronate dehydratase family protein [Acidimicrobiales bacterium]